MERLRFSAEYKALVKEVFGRDASEEECERAWQERQRELDREEREREEREREASVLGRIAEETSLSVTDCALVAKAVRGNRQLALDIQATSATPDVWKTLALPGILQSV